MRFLKLFIAVLFSCSVFAQQEFVVQSNHSGQIYTSALDSKRGVLVTYGINDKTLKFWNEKSGLLYKTLDLEKGITQLEINVKDGIVYSLGNNTITTYSTQTFEKLKEYPLGRIYGIQFFQDQKEGRLVLLAQDQNYMTSLYALDEKNGTFLPGNMAPVPTDAEINYFRFSNDAKRLYIAPNYGEYYVYSFETKVYTQLKGDYIMMFDNGDVLRAIYKQEESKLVYMRMDPISREVKWNKTISYEKEIEGMIAPTHFDASYSFDRKSIWLQNYVLPLTLMDAETGEMKGSFPKNDEAYALIDTGTYLYAQIGYDNKYGKFKLFDDTPIISYGNTVVEPTDLIGFQNGDAIELLFSSQYGTQTYSLLAHPKVTQFTKYITNYRDEYGYGGMIADPSSDKVFGLTTTVDPIKVFHRGKSNSFSNLIENYRDLQYSDFSPNTKQLALLYKSGLRIVNTETQAEVFFKPLNIDIGVFKNGMSLSPFNNAVAYTSQEIQADRIAYAKLHYFDFGANTEKWTKEGKYFGAFHIKGGKELLVSNATTNQIEILDTQTGALLRSIPTDFNGAQMDSFLSPNEEYLLYVGYNTGAAVIHLPTGKKINSFKVGNYGKLNGAFITNTVIAFAESGAIKFMDITNLKEVLRLYVFDDESWVAYTPEGQFDGSQEGWEKVAFVKGTETIPLESVFDQFYTPRLLYQVLAEKEFKSNVDLETMAPPPSISLTYKQGTRNLYVDDDAVAEITVESNTGKILLEAQSKESSIKEIRLYQNGKLVGNKSRNLFVDDDEASDPNTKELEIQLAEGLNEFSAVAVNHQGTESVPEKLNVTFIPKQQSLIKPQGIQAHLLVIGIDEYQNPKYNLNYAVADASGFQESVQQGLSKITSKTHVYFIKNSDAIRENILQKINEIASVANPQDIFIFYYAGHGVVSQEADKEFYLVPTDVTQLYGNDGALKQKGIAATELKKVASGIAAQKQLYILDACQSAGALTTLARGAAEEKAIAQLARSTGTHWLTASGSEQFATEFDELGHGVFTYALLEAISGKADSGDQRVTVNELKAYIESRVPEISEKYKGNPQYPSSFGFGQDFPISITNQ